MHRLAGVHHKLGNIDEALKIYEKALPKQQAFFGPDSPHVAGTNPDRAII